MNTVTCTDCHQTVTRGNAYLRSVSLELVATCTDCMSLRVAVDEAFVVAVAS